MHSHAAPCSFMAKRVPLLSELAVKLSPRCPRSFLHSSLAIWRHLDWNVEALYSCPFTFTQDEIERDNYVMM
jgi:hypothetical protein